jgi:carboxylate-amine ligase
VGDRVTALPGWARWSSAGEDAPWTVGIEEEVMLLEPDGWALASRIDDVLPALSTEVAEHAAAETHGSAIELASRPHATAGAAAQELEGLRERLEGDLAPLGLRAGVAGTHPFAQWTDVRVSGGPRYQSIYDSMRELARREPTFALHVHVAVPGAEAAVDALRGLRAHLPVLLGLSANSPFWQGRDTGLASARTPVFSTFPRTGIPRPFASYADYVEAVDVLVRCEAIPEPTFLWWDARLQPRFGTLEVRVMDAQTRAPDTAALAALVQCIVRLEATEGFASPRQALAMEVLDENRFLASRDGTRAMLIDVDGDARIPMADMLEALLVACAPHARDLGCEAELAGVRGLLDDPGDERQRRRGGVARGDPVGDALGTVVEALAADFTGSRATASGAPGAGEQR